MRESSTMPKKKPRVVWTDELHKVFLEAVNQLGIDKAVPKKILELMNIKLLTRENVASHLQKYRIFQKREREDARQNHGRSSPVRNVEHHLSLQSLRSLSSVLVNTQVRAYNSGPQLANPSNMMIPSMPFNSAAQLANSSNMRAPAMPFNSAAQVANSSNMRAPPLPFNSAAQVANSSNMRAPPLPFNSAAQLVNLSNRRPPPPLPSNPDRRLAMQRVPFNQTNYTPSNTGIRPFPGTPPLLRFQSRSDQCFNLPSSQMKVGSVFPVNSINGPSVPNHPGEQQHVAQQQAEDRELHRDNLLDIPETENSERLEMLEVKDSEDEFVFD
ncbi:uncharacterized protein [Typha angustifolia]|uniref:uncharacterized protein n=1 Tax=Typha angustifolia TaxID=59011 RepID=UPI003C2F8B73